MGEPLEPQAIAAPLALDGGAGADATTINLFGNGDVRRSPCSTRSSTASRTGSPSTPRASPTPFLLRAGLIALLSSPGDGAGLPYEVWNRAERITYGPEINAGVMLNLGAGDDRVAFDDTSALLTVNGEDGDDTFQVGQLVDNPLDFDGRYTEPALHGDHARAC